MKKLFLSLALAAVAFAASAQSRPKLVVGIAVDQMRWDYLYRYANLYTQGGFNRIMSEGYNCENTMINYVPSVTAIGHTSIYTGSVPAIHGITGNNMMVHDLWTYCCSDSTVQGVGTTSRAGQQSPCNLLATTIGDELKVATNYQSKVIGVAIKDRAAILPAGRSADAAYWVDGKLGRFVSSTFYMNQLPDWAVQYNNSIGKISEREINYSTRGNEITIDMAKAAIVGEKLGQHDQTDMICISFSSTDKIGHKYGTHCQLMQDIFVDLDKRLADFMTFLDKTVGKGQYLLFLSADHGAANNINQNTSHRVAAGGFFADKEMDALNEWMKAKYKVKDNLAKVMYSNKIFLDHEAISRAKLDLTQVRADVANYFLAKDCIAYAVDVDKVATSTIPSFIREKIINGHNHLHGGDVQLCLQPGWYEVNGNKIDDGTTHGAWNPYDAHIPFLLMGWGVKHGRTDAPTYIVDIAPTVCSLIHVQMPNGCIGNAVSDCWK